MSGERCDGRNRVRGGGYDVGLWLLVSGVLHFGCVGEEVGFCIYFFFFRFCVLGVLLLVFGFSV